MAIEDTSGTAPATHHILTGHLPWISLEGSDIEGVDVLLQEWTAADGTVTRELAVRPGRERRNLTWSPPTALVQEA